MGKEKNTLLKVLLALGIGYILYELGIYLADRLTKEENESNGKGKRNNKGSSATKPNK